MATALQSFWIVPPEWSGIRFEPGDGALRAQGFDSSTFRMKKRHSHIYKVDKPIKCFKCHGIRGEIMFCIIDNCRKRITRYYDCDCQGKS